MDFTFVADARFQKILERDYEELQSLNTQTATKSVIVLAGGIIEGLLFEALVASRKWTFEKACQSYLKDMIFPAMSEGIIKEERITDVVRKYRNLIHPGKEIRQKMTFDKTDADFAKTVVEIIIREVRTWSLAEQCRKKLTDYLSAINQNEGELIQMFALPRTTVLGQYEHPFLRSEVYQATRSLIKNGVLKKMTGDQTDNNKEKICLMPEAIEIIETLIIKGKIQRDSIVLDDRNIAASGMSGSGS
jgi:hypothetical protein